METLYDLQSNVALSKIFDFYKKPLHVFDENVDLEETTINLRRSFRQSIPSTTVVYFLLNIFAEFEGR